MSDTIADTQARFEAFITETFPEADVAPGSVLSELLIKLSAAVHNEISNDITDLSSSGSVADALASTTDTYNPVIDKIASNYNVTRNQGKQSTGKIRVYIARSRNLSLKAGVQFIQPTLNLIYDLAADMSISPTADTADGETQLFQLNNQYYFIAPVIADSVGSQYQVSDKTKFSVATDSSVGDFVMAEAYGNFTSGLPLETDKQLISRLKSGLSNKGLLSEQSILANLQTRDLSVQALTIVGAADSEMSRSKQNAFGISTLGMADVYVRTSIGPETIAVTKTATKVDTGSWQFVLDHNDVAGFYRILSVLPVGSSALGSQEITNQTFGYSITDFARANVINNTNEARFTQYQTCTVTFNYVESPLVDVGNQQDFTVVVYYQPNIAAIQNIFLDDTERIACADYLVKAVLPCFVSLNLKLFKQFSTDTLPVDKIKQDIFNYINTIPFGESLYISKIVDICHDYSIKRVDLPVTVDGEILCVDGTTLSISSTDVLDIPTNLTKGVTKNTTQFFIDYYTVGSDNTNLTDNIGIEVI